MALIPIGETRLRSRFTSGGIAGIRFRIDLGYGGNLNRQMKRANRLNAAAAVLMARTSWRAALLCFAIWTAAIKSKSR